MIGNALNRRRRTSEGLVAEGILKMARAGYPALAYFNNYFFVAFFFAAFFFAFFFAAIIVSLKLT